ncbi:PLxRFG domain-containing protein [Acinetobacter bereziniae]|uniref:PLxRFG domain-containing protein n=1 Tax=Acinetobacter bereziniae TaxID=106648 RepID=UPI001D0F113C|nr:PLxRFG domain-containing protein [Acinetobacter bereziniae]
MTESQNKNPFADPNYGKDLNSNGNSNPFSDPDYGKEQKKGIKGLLKDTGLSALSGAVAVPEMAVGVMDTMSDGAVGKTLENKDGSFGFRPKEAKQAIGNLHTEQYKAQQQEFADAGKDGNWTDKIVDKTKVALKNPSLITNTVVESVPSMLAGAIVGRASGITNPVVAGAVGEGSVMAGSQAEQIRQDTVDGRLTADQSLASATTGVLGGLIGFAGGRIAQKLGIGDVDTMLVNGKLGPAEIAGEVASMPAKSLPRRVIEGAISEGFLEELPQSVSEQILQNLALDKPWSDGIEDAAVMGTLAGMAMGGAANILSGRNNENVDQLNQTQINTPNQPLSQSSLSTGQDSSLTGEYIPRESSQSGTNQNRTTFEYDQPSKEADNLLGSNFKGDDGTDSNGNIDSSNNPVNPLSPNGGNYLNTEQLPSERLGINPNDGPMSSAAAIALDSGVTPMLGSPQDKAQNEASSSGTIPSNYQSLLGSDNENITSSISRFDQSAQSDKRSTINDSSSNQGGNLERASANDGVAQITEGTGSKTRISGSGVIETSSAPQGQPNSNNINTVGNASIISSKNEATATSSSTISTNASDSKSRVVEPIIEADSKNITSNDQNDFKKFQINNKTEEIAQLEQQFLDARSVSQKAKLRKQIDQLKNYSNENVSESKNIELNPEQIQKQYGDTPDSVMSDIEILGDDFTVDLREDKKKANALSNPNYNAMQKPDGSVEILGMKHPDTGEWVGKKPTALSVDENAHQAATSSQNNTPEPTQAQIEAGNYKKGHIKVQGLDISIENPMGSVRRGTDPNRKEWAHTMSDHYGYIKRTVGADSEQIDTYVGKNPDSDQVFIVDQIDQDTGNFDEHKVMLGFESQDAATKAYKSNFDKGWKVGQIRSMNMSDFKDWLKNGDTTKPSVVNKLPTKSEQSELQRTLQNTSDDKNALNGYDQAKKMGNQIIYSDNKGQIDTADIVIKSLNAKGHDFFLALGTDPQSVGQYKVISKHGLTVGGFHNTEADAIKIFNKKIESVTEQQLQQAIDRAETVVKESGKSQEELKQQFEDKLYKNSKESNEKNIKQTPSKNENQVSKPSNKNIEDSKKNIQDIGEKIGGARKDTALSTGKTNKTKNTDDRPTWAKRYVISEIVSSTNTEDNGKWVIEDSRKSDWKGNSKRMGTFSSKQEAEQMLPVLAVAQKHRIYARRESEGGFEIWRLINDYKRVKIINQVFETKEDAQKYIVKNAAQILEINTTFGEIDIPRPDNTLRKGVERRKGNVKDTDFMDVFDFRGVEFGNWNNQFERQQLLNDAFDGLLDLADVLNIPPKAISLNGDLALAFGARGQGLSSARAHYEPAKAVINLTKMNGAGSLAHEWWHAFDHYLARQDGKAVAEWTIGKDGTRSLKISSNTKNNMASGGFSYKNSGVRDEVKESYISLIQTMFSKAEEYLEDTQQVDNFVGKAREVVTQKLESIRNDLSKELDPKYYKRFNKPAPTELLTEFDTIAQQISQGEMLTTEWRTDVVNKKPSGVFSGARWTNDGLEKLSQIYKKVRGRSGFNTDQKGVLDQLRSSMNQYSSRLKMLAEAQKGSTKIKKVPTSFVMNAKDLDSGRGADYWTSPHEMSARAFQGFVEDKIKEQSGESPFLNYAPENAVIETPWGWTRPFPHGSERKAINEKFDNLVAKLKTEETETGIKLYSRGKLKPDEERKGTSPIETTFNALSVVSASRRVLSVLQHLKLSATQDSLISGRITVGSAGIKGGFNVQVISSFDGLPAEIQKDATYQDDKGNTQNYDVSAVWHDGTLYVVADQVYGDSTKQLTTFDAYEEMLAHEIIGHFGIQQLFGQEYKSKLQQLYNALGKLDGIRKIASNNGVDMAQFESAYIKPYTQGAKDGIYTESDVQQALVGELFAFVAQNARSRPFVRQKLQEVIGYIRQWFRDRGFDKFLSRYNDSDLMMYLSEARKAVIDRSYFGKYKNQEFSSKNDSDTPLYSRSRENKAGSTVKQVRDLLIERFGKETINELEQQGKLEIIQDYSVDGVEGFYYNGKAVLVASNLTSESTVPTFLHELGGHAGFQNMMNQEQYSELMRQFDKLVEQGNPVALAAKLLAEREQGNVRQQLEYLPYLLTLSSTMQQRNVVQRNALQKLIQNIVSYVKAWVFDNFGINLNLNPDDIVALSERMVNQIKQQTSLDTVRQKYQGTSQWMTAPNGAKSNLNEQQWLQVRTPEFKKWFGDWENDAQNSSQVLDENGEPKVVYHGTNAEFNEFKKGHGLLGEGIYLTDSFDTADMYANNRGKNGFVLPLFVNIRSALNTKGNVSRDQVVQATKSGKYQGIVHQFEDQEFIVALESNQVKMAEGNTGTFNSESADIRFSRSAKETIDKLSKKISDLSVKSIKEKSSYKYTDWLGIGLSTLGRRQLTEIYNKLLPQLTKYNDLAAQMDADKNDAGAEADSIVREWANLKDENQLADLMHDATLAKIDPAKPHVKGDSVIKYKQLRVDFNALSPEAQAMYIKARDAYKSHYAKVQSAIKERILRASLSSQKKADLIKQMDDQFFGYVKGVYFPLARFGKYVVVARNNLGQVESVSRAETMGEAQKARAEMMKKYPEWKVDRVILDKEFSASRDAAGRGFMSSLFDEVANLGLSPSEMVEFEDTLNQLYLSSMPDLSWAKHGIHRKGTAGFSQDARRAFAQNMFHGAGYLAKLRYGDQLAQQLDDMQKYATEQAKQDSNYDQPSAQRVIDEMNKRHDNLMNPKSHPLSSALTSFGFIYYLGLSPAAAIVNLSQTALMAYPIMGAKWGFDKAANELLKASNDFRKGVDFHKVKWEGTKTDLYKTVSSDISKFLNKDEKQAYDDAVARGVIDVTQAHDLAGIAQGEDSGIMWKTRPIMRAASVMFHSAERFNREVTFIAAYRLARQAGSNHDSAFDQAVDATYKGHFDYSSGNRPRIMQGNVAKVLLLFKQFGQNMIYTLARQTYQSIKGETDAERKEARKSLAAILAMHATFAGVLGLPMVGMMLSLASWAGGDDDDPWDAEVALRNYLAETFGPTISNLLMKGAPRALTPADISSRVGINNLLLPDVQEGLEGKRWAESAMAGALGPVAGIGLNVAKGTQEISEGHNLRGLETMLPVFLKNFAKTYRYGEEGVQDKTGVSIMDEVSSMDLLVQGMGFSPSDVRTANEGKSAIYQLDKKLNARRGRLMALWSRAKMMDDQAEMDNIWNDIEKFNEKNPSRRITRVNLNQSYKNRQRRIDRSEDGIYLSRNRQEARSAGYFAFGD